MKVIITEDIIKNALNESIDEFIINEGWFNDSMLGKVWNGVKNAAAMYMDNRTNGQWNNKYGIYANGNGKATELYYLNKWFNFHLEEIKKIDYYLRNPRNAQSEIEWKIDPKTGEKKGVQTINNYDNIQNYAIQNINSQSFNKWIGYYIDNRDTLECIDKYINDCSKTIKDINSASKWLNISSFLSSRVGQYYLKMTKAKNIQKQQERDWRNYYRSRQNSGAYD